MKDLFKNLLEKLFGNSGKITVENPVSAETQNLLSILAKKNTSLKDVLKIIDAGADINSIPQKHMPRIKDMLSNEANDIIYTTNKWRTEYHSIITLTEKQGEEFVKELFKDGAASYILNLASENSDPKLVRRILTLAEKLGPEFIEQMLIYKDFFAFRKAVENGDTEIYRDIMKLAEKQEGAVSEKEMLRSIGADAFRVSRPNASEIRYLMAANKNANMEFRELVGDEYRYEMKYMFSYIKNINPPSFKNYRQEGMPYEFGLALNALGKITKLTQEGLCEIDIDVKKLISNHTGANGKALVIGNDVNWEGLNDTLDGITHKKLGEITDTLKEISGYVAGYLLADSNNYVECLDSKSLEEALKPFKDKVVKYFLENHTLPQMAKLSDQWHRFRTSRIKSSHDGSTLRDFATSGSWHQVIEEKEIKVTKPGLKNYTIVNLTNSGELMEEHHALGHCVDGYVDNCKKGYQVFSIRKDGIPQTTMGFNVENGKLKLHQNYGQGNRNPDLKEKEIEKWFVSGVIKADLSTVGDIHKNTNISEFENQIGIKLKNLTPERVQSNLNLITELGKEYGQWSEKSSKRNVYMFGNENKGVSLEQFAANIGVTPAKATSKPASEVNLININSNRGHDQLLR